MLSQPTHPTNNCNGASSDANPPSSVSLPPHYLRDEAAALQSALASINLDAAMRRTISGQASQLAARVRLDCLSGTLIDSLLLEYGLSNEEGIVLMRLAEALIRTPDKVTAALLVRDKIGSANWAAHRGHSQSPMVNAATSGLRLSAAWISTSGGPQAERLYGKLGDAVMVQVVSRAMAMMGDYFVLGQNIEAATRRAASGHAQGCLYSYDMLGEAALTEADATTYFNAYLSAMQHLAACVDQHSNVSMSDSLSIKLSALHPRFEYGRRDTCVPQLVARVTALAKIAKRANLGLTIDAEEADRMEVTLLVFERLLQEPELVDWSGLGLVVQAYQRRALALIDTVTQRTRMAGRKISIRLVKGAYWDMEIKRAQELGLQSYPVFTRKENTDANYLACARALLCQSDIIFPQFATHNAHSAVAVIKMAEQQGLPVSRFEMQRLHGMGAELHARLAEKYDVKTRIYAPVGAHKDLLAYLVRRLLENGANSSFVNQLTDQRIAISDIVRDPLQLCHANETAAHPKINKPTACVEAGRLQADGYDWTQSEQAAFLETAAQQVISDETKNGAPVFSPQAINNIVAYAPRQKVEAVSQAIDRLGENNDWAASTAQYRADILKKTADLLAADITHFIALLVQEAGKTIPDAISEIREAIDFCRYYANQAVRPAYASRDPLGVVAAISPWNFPLAIFLGQITAALSVGNRVVAKPAEQTPLVGMRAIDILHRAGVPKSALALITGDGRELGDALIRHSSIDGVLFTGSTATAKKIANGLAVTGRGDIPLIAETGGLNAMIIDSTALLEQAVQDVLDSSFQSAGQRCSACRLVCVQEDVYDAFVDMLCGAMDELGIGHPNLLKTDVGPLIDAAAHEKIEAYKTHAAQKHKVLKSCTLPKDLPEGYFSAPILIELENIAALREEIFGPVLHIVKFKASHFEGLLGEINAMGYGLTMGLHTRLDSRVALVLQNAHIGNIYVNRNQIGAVVGVQPFGGEKLSGTGPKAGGPHYLSALTRAHKTDDNRTVRDEAPIKKADIESKKRLAHVLASAAKAAQDWRGMADAPARARQLFTALAHKTQPSLSTDDLSYAVKMPLPGPTGEENVLHLRPRGVILCFGASDVTVLCHQLGKILSAGSAAMIAAPSNAPAVALINELIDSPDLPRGLVQLVSHKEALSIVTMSIDAIVADGASRPTIAARAALREGPIMPLLSGLDPIERYCHERCMSINVTAAGGNVSLLTLAEPICP